ncbi:eukaryotic translation initiation factor 4B2 [Eucalyptus grandis]|uniref:eukaryotic translation initiation factor 4B2 n=1 Tax=Eucalyptus grandis TaxID=71139 RepID=UPI00192EF4CD|nr:eukaryotic translation initiation factor 4B2 [Eucalyptus grandis]
MSKPWGNIGAWAAEAEQAEAEEAAAAAAAAAPQNFPSLREAVSAKPKKKKMSLTEFYVAASAGGGRGGGSKGLTPDEMMRLPTGPKERSAEEMQYGRLGGGFSSYGRSGPMPNRGREDGDTSWGGGGSGGGRRSYGGFEDDRHGPPSSRVSEFDQPSRADEVDNWAMGKKPLPSLDSSRQTRYDSLGGGSRADDVDNWAVGKKPQPPPPSRSFGSGFRDAGMEPDRWNRGGGGGFNTERPKLVLAPPKGDSVGNEVVKSTRASPFGAARPREDVLAEKGLDYRKLESEIETKKTSRPTSAQSSRPSSAQSSRSESQGLQGIENVARPRPKVNPFGDAKPREVLLQEKGMDWRKIDFELEHRRVDRPQTEQEKMLKEEIENLKKEMEKELALKANNEHSQGSEADQPSLSDAISLKERELEALTRDLDDKVRFGQKSVDRPGSGYGRSGSFSDRPPSRSGSIDESRSMDYNDRPSSRGMGDAWSRSGNDRRPFQGGRDSGFLASRDSNRSRSRERW